MDALALGPAAVREAGLHPVALLPAKLAPPDLAHATITRRRLLGQLSRAVQRSPLTQVSGPAGSGKTVLVAAWRETEASSRCIAWLTLDDEDDEPATFWTYVVEALRSAGVPLPDVPGLTRGEPLPGGFVPALAAGVAGRPAPVVLIVDNADHLADKTVIAGLDLLIRHTGGSLHLVLCARADPPLPLHQYRLAGTMSEIRGAQLAFTARETHEVLAAMGVPVSADVAERLCAETQGWAVGLRLAAAPLKQGTPPERLVTELAHDDGSVAQYLFAEVLAGQPASVRRLLLRISVTAELHPDLVDRLSGRPNSRRVLAALAHANSFVEESAGEPGGLRIHPLFREMLTAQLAFDHPGEVAGLHRTCAVWYAAADRPTQAIEHALAAEDWPFAAQLLVDDLVVLRLLAHGSLPADVADLRTLPAGLRGPDGAVLRAASALAAGEQPAAADLAAIAVSDGARPALRFSAALTCLTAAVAAGADGARVQALAGAAQSAFAQLPEEDRQGRREYLAVLAGARAFATLCGNGPVEEVLAQMRAAAAAAHAAGARLLRSRAVGPLAVLEASAGLLTRALQHAAEAETLCADAGIDERQRPTASATALASVHLQRYALVEAREWLTRALTRERDAITPEAAVTAAVLAVVHAQLLRLRREYDVSEATLAPHLPGRDLPDWVRGLLLVEAARLALDRGRPDEALRLLEDPVVAPGLRARMRATAAVLGAGGTTPELTAEAHGAAPVVVVESLLLRSCQLAEAGRVAPAVDELGRALDFARPELFRLPFVAAPPQIRRLLRTHPRLQGPAAWLSPSSPGGSPAGAAAGGRAEPAAVVPLTQELSERETEVLQRLAEMLSTAEIAAAMFISVNTVRTHIRSILRKLGVTRRNQAVRRARDLGLL